MMAHADEIRYLKQIKALEAEVARLEQTVRELESERDCLQSERDISDNFYKDAAQRLEAVRGALEKMNHSGDCGYWTEWPCTCPKAILDEALTDTGGTFEGAVRKEFHLPETEQEVAESEELQAEVARLEDRVTFLCDRDRNLGLEIQRHMARIRDLEAEVARLEEELQESHDTYRPIIDARESRILDLCERLEAVRGALESKQSFPGRILKAQRILDEALTDTGGTERDEYIDQTESGKRVNAQTDTGGTEAEARGMAMLLKHLETVWADHRTTGMMRKFIEAHRAGGS